jgi:hypothetical protein
MNRQDELIFDLLLQGTHGTTEYDGEEVVDNMCMSSYEDACEYLEERGVLEKINSRIYRIVHEDGRE